MHIVAPSDLEDLHLFGRSDFYGFRVIGFSEIRLCRVILIRSYNHARYASRSRRKTRTVRDSFPTRRRGHGGSVPCA